jgi:DmsE family decaheme c-type cytochrome
MKEKGITNKLKIGLAVALIAIAAFSAKTIIAQSAGGTEKKEKAPAYIGTETCLTCHDGYDKSFMATKHRMLFKDVKAKGAKNGCEACHGPAEKHLDNPEEGVARFGKMKSGEISNACLKCHMSGDKMNWKVSTHAEEDVSCIKSHSVHGKKAVKKGDEEKDKSKIDPPSLLVDSELDLCLSCHEQKTAEIAMPSHHPIREGKVACSSCHSPHDNSDLQVKRAGSACVKCHTEKAGPFALEHDPVVESCTTCHTPHGSVNQQLLVLRQPALCLQCHTATPVTHNTGTSTYKKCTSCHEKVHGSNYSSGKFID